MGEDDGSVDAMLAPQMCELLMWRRKTLAFLRYLSYSLFFYMKSLVM